jgi:hypothetical protein
MVYIRMHYVLSEQENLLSILVMLVSAITGVVALVGGLKDMKNAGGGKTSVSVGRKAAKEDDEEEEEDLPDDFETCDATGGYPEFDVVPAPDALPLKNAPGSYGNSSGAKRTDQLAYSNEIAMGRSHGPLAVRNSEETSATGDVQGCGETVLLDENFSDEMALFSRNLDRTVRIALSGLPITVGKMEGCVDRVLKDNSVSRMHCRFVGEGDRVAVLDLGSTNGTYRNGVRLRPQEKTYIEAGDEIRIGRVCFDCR